MTVGGCSGEEGVERCATGGRVCSAKGLGRGMDVQPTRHSATTRIQHMDIGLCLYRPNRRLSAFCLWLEMNIAQDYSTR
jgi:hypothetical protein